MNFDSNKETKILIGGVEMQRIPVTKNFCGNEIGFLKDNTLDLWEENLQAELENTLNNLDFLYHKRNIIKNPEALCGILKNIILEQIRSQIGIQIGEDFITENHGHTLDLSDSAHIQTTENFKQGKIASHNDKINFQERYDNWQACFKKDDEGKILMHSTRTGRFEPTLTPAARAPFDSQRPMGSKEKKTAMDHVISVGEIIRDAEANAHLSLDEQLDFANSAINLNEINYDLNASKGDLSTSEWLDTPNRNGQKPSDIFDIDEQTDYELRERDRQARSEWEKRKHEGEKKSKETGRQSQKEEAFRIGKGVAKAVILSLLTDCLKDIIANFIIWLKKKEKSIKSLLAAIKESVYSFIVSLKQKLLNIGQTVLSTVCTAIFGPIVRTFNKFFLLLKQGVRSLQSVIVYLKSPEVRQKSLGLVIFDVGKIIMSGMVVGGALVLGDVIEKGLMSFPVFAVEIPFLGSLANVIGVFLGAVISGIIGAVVINFINNIILKREQEKIELEIIQNTEFALQAHSVLAWSKLSKTIEKCETIADEAVISFQNAKEKEQLSLVELDKAYQHLLDSLS